MHLGAYTHQYLCRDPPSQLSPRPFDLAAHSTAPSSHHKGESNADLYCLGRAQRHRPDHSQRHRPLIHRNPPRVARAPRYFVQVVFAALDDESIYLAGRPAGEGHIWVRADIRAGRTDEQKNELIERILTELGALTGVSPEHIWVYISDIPGPSVAEFGRVLPHPGGEDAWFASLPEDLKAQLREQA